MAKTTEPTPVMKQYLDAKAKVPDALLLFRMGDFYEVFYDDAVTVAGAVGLALTTRDRDKGPNSVPMAGFPHHQLDIYLSRLIAAGFKVAVCEQLEDPKLAKGIVKRDLVRIVSPGTVTDDAILDPKKSNYLAAISLPSKPRFAPRSDELIAAADDSASAAPRAVHPDEAIGLAWVELSTGEFTAAVTPYRELFDYLARIHPSEILISESSVCYFPAVLAEGAMLTKRPDWTFRLQTALETLLRQLRVKTLAGFGFETQTDALALEAAGAALDYLRETQKSSLEHLDSISKYRSGQCLEIDQATIRSLEILQTTDGRRAGSLLAVLDQCVTPMGSRLLAEWIIYPLCDIEAIRRRLDAVENLFNESSLRDNVRQHLRRVHDLARIMTRVVQGRVTPRELAAVAMTLLELPFFRQALEGCPASLLAALAGEIEPQDNLAQELLRALGEEPPLTWRDGGFIQPGYCQELDDLRDLQHGGKQWLAAYQQSESQRTGIATLRVGFNSVFGYYIEIPRSQADKTPANYVRKQTLKNAERYITEELKAYEEKVLTAEESAKNLELKIFAQLRDATVKIRSEIQQVAAVLAQLDVLANFAHIASARGYTRPNMVSPPVLTIRDGRHPVLEQTEAPGTFTPNDAQCRPDGAMIHLITGPNMAGKSTYIRQVALLVLMAHAGSFLPASFAEIGRTDRIFARVGASDELTRGLSTFMVEMIETARILNGVTRSSLVVLDEIGRGTSTYDGISLAWAITESLLETTRCRTFFATHYHELTDLAETHDGIDNLNVAVREWGDDIAFLHKIVAGPADKSYGIHVARLAGIPSPVIRRAKRILEELESSHMDAAREAMGDLLRQVGSTPFEHPKHTRSASEQVVQFSLFGPENHPVLDELRELDPNTLTPIDALTLLSRWKGELSEEDEPKEPASKKKKNH